MRILVLLAFISPLAFAPPLARGLCTSTISLVDEITRNPDWKLFSILYSSANPAPVKGSHLADNQHYLNLIESPEAPKLWYIHGALKPLKQLNDKVFSGEESAGKKDVDAARNLFRVLFFENLEAHPELSNALKGRFFDFKILELAIDPSKSGFTSEQHFVEEVNHVIRVTQMQFDSAMIKFAAGNPVLMDRVLKEHGLTGDFRSWHLFGISKEHPDRAAAAARTAQRQYTSERGVPLKAVPYTETLVTEKLAEVDSQRTALVSSLGRNSEILIPYEKTGLQVLSPHAIDILRKISAAGKEDYIEKVRSNFRAQHFTDALSDAQIIQLRDYFSLADEFQPPLRIAERVQIDLDRAKKGALNVDFAGQNVVNLFHTMGAIAQAKRDGKSPFELIRQGETKATERLNTLAKTFDEARKAAGIDGSYERSGDDGTVYLENIPTAQQKTALFRELAKRTKDLSEFRIVWVPPIYSQGTDINGGAMSKESVKGENLEKKLRQKLFAKLKATPTQTVSQQLKATLFTMEMNPTTHQMRMYVVGANPEILSAVQSIILEKDLIPEGYSGIEVTATDLETVKGLEKRN